MRLCAEFPTIEIGSDVGGLRAFAQAIQDLGFEDLLVYDHVLGASAAHYDKKKLVGGYREHDMFHEPFVLFGFFAGIAPKLGYCTNVMVLPQRQTVLAAKQAAQVDLLCGGRLRLGIGIGWNYVEYEGLGVPFKERAARQEEQIHLMRELWTKPIVDFQGRFHRVTHAGLNPLPVQRPIPIWLGGMAEPVLKRVGTLADGWFPAFPSLGGPTGTAMPMSNDAPAAIVERMRSYAHGAGRDPATIGINCDLWYANQTPDVWSRHFEAFRALGATHVTINTMGAGLRGADAHIEALRRVRASI
jgi:probable F420-dependent oxidoreductase